MIINKIKRKIYIKKSKTMLEEIYIKYKIKTIFIVNVFH